MARKCRLGRSREKIPTTKKINGHCEKREAYKESELRSINLSIFSTTYMLQIGIQQLSTAWDTFATILE